MEKPEASPLTLGARPMTSGKRGGFIEKEQLSIATGGHNHSVPASECQEAIDPAPPDMMTSNPLLSIVKATSVAHQCAAKSSGNKFAEGIYAVLFGHTWSLEKRDGAWLGYSCRLLNSLLLAPIRPTGIPLALKAAVAFTFIISNVTVLIYGRNAILLTGSFQPPSPVRTVNLVVAAGGARCIVIWRRFLQG